MSQISGDATDRAFKLMIDGVEVMVRLTGSGAKNLATALYAYYKGEKKLKGATNLNKLLKSGKELQIFRLAEKDLQDFKVQATKYGILFSAVKDTRADDGFVDVFIKKEDISKVNHVLGRMDYNQLSHEHAKKEQTKENEQPKKETPQRTSSNMQKSSSRPEKANIQQVIKDINEGRIDALTPDNWKAYLTLNTQMYEYSQGNMQRIFEQNPNASVVMSKSKWRELGRYPMQGAEGILITMPEHVNGERTGNFIDAKVYNISETYGKDISKSKYTMQLAEGSQALKSEIDRLRTAAPIPVEEKSDLSSDCLYSTEDKRIYYRDDISDTELYKGLCRETQQAKAHELLGAEYSRDKNQFVAESVAYSMAMKFGMDTSEFNFESISEQIKEMDAKGLGKLVDSVVSTISAEIRKAEQNLEQFKSKEQPSVNKDLQEHKKAIDRGNFKVIQGKQPDSPLKGKDR